MIYLTEYWGTDPNGRFRRRGDQVEASSWEEAVLLADARGRNEVVVGTLLEAGPEINIPDDV